MGGGQVGEWVVGGVRTSPVATTELLVAMVTLTGR